MPIFSYLHAGRVPVILYARDVVHVYVAVALGVLLQVTLHVFPVAMLLHPLFHNLPSIFNVSHVMGHPAGAL